jgi:hypothetical protein
MPTMPHMRINISKSTKKLQTSAQFNRVKLKA